MFSLDAVARQVPMYDNIPTELRHGGTWVVYKLEWLDGPNEKPKKVPYSPVHGRKASITNPADWGTFDQAVAMFSSSNGEFSGIGRVFTADDPYCFIDFDEPQTDEQRERHKRLLAKTEGYAEWSQSGVGIHVICRGSIGKGVRRDQIEIYSQERYAVFTGNVYRAGPIVDQHALVNVLADEMRPSRDTDGQFAPGQHREATEADDEIHRRAASAADGGKFVRLWNGDATAVDGADGSGSAIDQALVNILQFWTKDPVQIERMWLASPQGQRSKTQDRKDYRDRTIARAFDQEVAPQDVSSLQAKLAEMIAERERAEREKATHNPGGTKPTGLLPIINASEFAGRSPAPRSWLVADMIPYRNVTLFGGDGGTGKSLATLQLAYAVASGNQWFGQAVTHGPALFLTAEDEIDEVHRRLFAIALSEGRPVDSLPHNLAISSLAGHDALLATFAPRSATLTPTELCLALWAYCDEHRPAVVVLDTLADLFGGEENNRVQTRQFIGMLRHFALELNVAVILLAHPSLSGIASGSGTSGSTAWNNSVRSRLYLKADGTERILETMKSNYGPTGNQLRLEYRSGVFVKIGHTSQEPAHRREAEDEIDSLFLRLLAQFAAANRDVSPEPSSRTNAALQFARTTEGERYKRPAFERAMERLFEAGRIRVEHVGSPAKRKPVVVAVQPSDPFRPPFGLGSDPHSDPRSDLC